MPFKDPKKRMQYDAERKKRQRQDRQARLDGPPGGNPLPVNPPVEALPLRTAHHALDILREQINLVRADQSAGIQSRARSCAYLMSVALKAIDLTDLSERIAALEAQAQ